MTPDPTESVPLLWLASASPRRRALLRAAGLRFDVHPADIDEAFGVSEPPRDAVARLARAKALTVARLAPPGTLVLAADTAVAIQERILGKPRDPREAAEMLENLSGRIHRVWSGVALAARDGPLESFVCCSVVRFHALTTEAIEAYVASGEGLDKAGAYAIQGAGGRRLVAEWQGSFSNVVGLPLRETLEALARHGLRSAASPDEVERRIARQWGP